MEEGQATETQAPAVTSLDGLSEFEFQGERLTPERLQEVFNGYRSLSEKQKQYESEGRYQANLEADLENVLENPALAEKFKQVYPAKYHGIVDRLMAKLNPQGQGPQLPKEITSRLSKLDQLEQRLEAMALESANAKLDATLPRLQEKFPLMNEDQVLAKAEIFLAQGGKLTDQAWERLAKESHEKMYKASQAYFKKQLEAQKEKGMKASDVGPGGAPAGKAPVRPKNFDEAREAMLKELRHQGHKAF
jgi:hypothetical protein